MNKQIVYIHVDDLEKSPTRHKKGSKKVFLDKKLTESNITQIAYGFLNAFDITEEHIHPTMEEVFYFLKGLGEYVIDGEKYVCAPGVFLKIPAGVKHFLKSVSQETLEFYYLGIAIK
jgi:quercetin dioxygenase-like cupin family protein